MNAKVKYWSIIPAAGLGLRMGVSLPKQYVKLAGKPILQNTIDKITSYPSIDKVIVVLHSEDKYWQTLEFSDPDKIITTTGGESRAHSVLNGLKKLANLAADDDWVLVHDAVRPFISHDAIDRLIKQLDQHPVGGILAIPVHDTLKQANENDEIVKTISRQQLWRAQTPQMFRYRLLLNALEGAINVNADITDESSAVEFAGKTPKVIMGDSRNIKITRAEDLKSVPAELNLQ